MDSIAAAAVGNGSLLGLRMTMSLVPIIGMLVALILFKKKYMLTDEKLDEITVILNSEREE